MAEIVIVSFTVGLALVIAFAIAIYHEVQDERENNEE
jgi:hypothetical protein